MKKRIQSVKSEAVLKRLHIVLKDSGMSGRQFAVKIGLKAESATRLFNGVTGLTKPLAYSIELHFGFGAKWLFTGEESIVIDQSIRDSALIFRIWELIDEHRKQLGKFDLPPVSSNSKTGTLAGR